MLYFIKVVHFRALLFVSVYTTGTIPQYSVKDNFLLENQLLMLLKSIQVHSMHGTKTLK